GSRKNTKLIPLIEANIAGPFIGDNVHPGRLGIQSLRGKCFDERGTDAMIAVFRSYIDMQVARVRGAIWSKRLTVAKVIEERIKQWIFKASSKVSNQDTIIGAGDEETIDVVLEIAIELFRFERIPRLFIGKYLNRARIEKNALDNCQKRFPICFI